jgi:hypothetical protein
VAPLINYSITRSRKPDKLSGFAMSFLCGIKYLAQKKPDKLSGFSSIAGYQPAPPVQKHKNRTQMFGFFKSCVEIKRLVSLRPNIRVRFGASRLKKQTLFLISLSHGSSARIG